MASVVVDDAEGCSKAFGLCDDEQQTEHRHRNITTERLSNDSAIDVDETSALLGTQGEENGTNENIQRENGKSILWLIGTGLSFMVVFSAFNTNALMTQVVIESIKEQDPEFKGSGYISLAVIYAVFATTNWLAPSVLSFIGPKGCMIAGGVTYAIFIAGFLLPHTWLLYLTSVLVGAGAALIWTGQGNYLTLMSDESTISRNSGIFWAMLQSSLLFGNLFVYFQFQGQTIIGDGTRLVVFSVLTVVAVIGVLIMLFLPKPGSANSGRTDDLGGPYQALKSSFALFKTRDMLLLSATFFYTGIELSFFSGVYSATISFTNRFPDSKKLVGLSGICIGCGEILGGAVFGIFGKKTDKFGRDPIVLLGYLVHIVCFYLIFINLPSTAPLGDTLDPSYLPHGQPSEAIALFCSFLLGLGDACYNTQIYSILGSIYSDQSGPAFALFKFTQSLSAAACFFYSSVLELNWHLLIMVIFSTIGTLTFCLVEWRAVSREKAKPDTVAYD